VTLTCFADAWPLDRGSDRPPVSKTNGSDIEVQINRYEDDEAALAGSQQRALGQCGELNTKCMREVLEGPPRPW
jgi:hypothetical protein